MNEVQYIINGIGIAGTLFAIINIIFTIIFWFFGIAPIIKRIGINRWKRKIFIVSGNKTESDSIVKDLKETGIIREKLIEVLSLNDLDSLDNSRLTILEISNYSEKEIIEILNKIKSNSGIVVYAKEHINDKIKQEINKHRFAILVNMRGRLINDIATMLISLSYEK